MLNIGTLFCNLLQPTFEAEDRLWKEVLDECRIVFTPGKLYLYSASKFLNSTQIIPSITISHLHTLWLT